MKKIGLIGGLGWVSTMEYYRIINLLVGDALGKEHSAEIILVSIDQAMVEKYVSQGDEEGVYQLLCAAGNKLKVAGADFGLLCANGVHRFFKRLEVDLDLPLIHIADATAKTIKLKQIKTIGLLGIRATMEQSFYRDRLSTHGISTLIPDEKDRLIVDEIIFHELVRNKFTEKSKQIFLEVIDRLRMKGADGVVLGCTEIPLLIQQKDSQIPLFETTAIHCSAAVNKALKIS